MDDDEIYKIKRNKKLTVFEIYKKKIYLTNLNEVLVDFKFNYIYLFLNLEKKKIVRRSFLFLF